MAVPITNMRHDVICMFVSELIFTPRTEKRNTPFDGASGVDNKSDTGDRLGYITTVVEPFATGEPKIKP